MDGFSQTGDLGLRHLLSDRRMRFGAITLASSGISRHLFSSFHPTSLLCSIITYCPNNSLKILNQKQYYDERERDFFTQSAIVEL